MSQLLEELEGGEWTRRNASLIEAENYDLGMRLIVS